MKRKSEKIEMVRDILLADAKIYHMKIFIQGKPKKFYRAIPWDRSVDVVVPNEMNAQSLAEFLTR